MPKSKPSKRRPRKRAARAKTVQGAKRRTPREPSPEAEAHRRLDELFSDAAPVERSAELILEHLETRPVPAGITRFFLIGSSGERARAVAAEVQRRAPARPTALTPAVRALARPAAARTRSSAHSATPARARQHRPQVVVCGLMSG